MEQPWVKTAGEAIGLIAGAVALIYLLGGLVYALRLAFDGFAIDSIVAVLGQLPRETLITAGFLEGLAPAAVVGLVAAVVYGALNRPKPRTEQEDRLDRGPRWALKLAGLLALSLAMVSPALLLAARTHERSWMFVTSLLGVAVTFGAVCTGWFLLRRLAKKEAWWYRVIQAIAAGALWAGMALVPSIMLGAAIPLESARVCVRDSNVPQRGELIAETKERVLLAVARGEARSVLSLPASRIRRVEYGELAPRTVCPAADPRG